MSRTQSSLLLGTRVQSAASPDLCSMSWDAAQTPGEGDNDSPDPGQPWPLQPLLFRCREREDVWHGTWVYIPITLSLISSPNILKLYFLCISVSWIDGGGMQPYNLLSSAAPVSANVICMLLTCSMLAQCQEALIWQVMALSVCYPRPRSLCNVHFRPLPDHTM